jgi:hypothetical protein
MIHVWRLSEATADNLGLACTENGLLLGQTPLIERRDGRFVVRARTEIERLLERAYRTEVDASRLIPGLATVASALNANDPCLARIAAVHLKIPDLPSAAARDAIAAEDVLIKSADWNPDLHPRAGAPPNPGWFAPTNDGNASPTRTAQNDESTHRTDVTPSADDGRAKLPPGERIDELGDFLEWLANAKPEDGKTIRAEIKRYYYDVGDTVGGDALNAALSDVLEPGITSQARQEILNGIAPYANADPAEIARARNLTVGAILLLQGGIAPATVAAEAPSPAWKLGWAARGQYFDALLRDGSLPGGFRTIDNFTDGIATSIKSIDLNAATYQDAMRLTYRLNQYIGSLADYEGGILLNAEVKLGSITERSLNLVIPKGSMTTIQRQAIEAARIRALATNGYPVQIVITPF